MKKFFKVYTGPGYPICPKSEEERRDYANFLKFDAPKPMYFAEMHYLPLPKDRKFMIPILHKHGHSQN